PRNPSRERHTRTVLCVALPGPPTTLWVLLPVELVPRWAAILRAGQERPRRAIRSRYPVVPTVPPAIRSGDRTLRRRTLPSTVLCPASALLTRAGDTAGTRTRTQVDPPPRRRTPWTRAFVVPHRPGTAVLPHRSGPAWTPVHTRGRIRPCCVARSPKVRPRARVQGTAHRAHTNTRPPRPPAPTGRGPSVVTR